MIVRTVLSVLTAVVLAVPLGAAPAHAVTERRCHTTALAKRCAEIEGRDGAIYASADVNAVQGTVRVRIVSLKLQFRMSDGTWVNNTVHRGEGRFVKGGAYSSTATSCDGAADGRWRSRAVVQWKKGRDGDVHTGRVTSDAVSRDRLCA